MRVQQSLFWIVKLNLYIGSEKYLRHSSRSFSWKYARDDPTLPWWRLGELGRDDDIPPSFNGVVGSLIEVPFP